jgi:hypothetical protein
MSAVTKKHEDWDAWCVGDGEVRVQINRPDMARAFAKVKGAWPAGYSVAGNYMKLFHVNQSVQWVDSWMKNFTCQVSSGTYQRKETGK